MSLYLKNKNYAIVLFDGICNFCSRSVQFIIRRDPAGYFRFAALQTEKGRIMAEKYGINLIRTNSIILIENERVYYRSDAALRIFRKLRGVWKLFYAFIIVPSFIRNFIYDYIARNRYKWFGTLDNCFIPDESIKSRFLL
jgi:predicted DCC family thiol-disulfide oxidoreductase YuxK